MSGAEHCTTQARVRPRHIFLGRAWITARLQRHGTRRVDEVRTTLNVMAPGGGYMASPAHRLLANVGWGNVLAFHEGVKRYGGYRQ